MMADFGKYSDQELVSLLQDKDHAAFTYIYQQYWMIMYSHALRMIKNEDDAQDTVQELFLNLYQKADQLRPDSKIGSYLFINLRNQIINLIQKQKVRADYLDTLMHYPEPSGTHILEAIHEKEIRQAMDAEIARMPPKMREAFELSRKACLSHKEIAEQLHIRESTVKTHINNALKLIRKKMLDLTFLFSLLYILVRGLF